MSRLGAAQLRAVSPALLLLAALWGWAAPCLALTELSGSPPWQLNIAGETYQFASSLGDSIEYNGTSTVLQFQAANITLDARSFKITKASGAANELIQLSSTGARINQLRSANLELEFPSGADAIFDGCDFEIRNAAFSSKLIALTSSSSNVRFWNCRLASTAARDMIDVAGTSHSFENCLAISTNQEAFVLSGAGPYSIVGCTIGGFGQGAVVSSMSNPATLTFWNNILLTSDEICFDATDATWSGWTQSHNWYNGPNPLITYGGTNYSDASTFEANSDNGDPLLVDADETIRGDYRVATGSGPVDQGDSGRNTLIFDILGFSRERGEIDMGCYEYQPSDFGACCFADGSCVVTTQSLCLGGSGTWTEGGDCDPNDCAQVGACCLGQDECEITLDSLCDGTFLGEGSTCDPGVCVFGCPPPGYTEITQGQLPIFISTDGSKWAVCDSLYIDNTYPGGSNWAAITIAASNVSLTGMNIGSVTAETTDDISRQLLQLRRPESGTSIRDISFHCRINNTGETSCYLQHDDMSFRNVRWTGWDFLNVYANATEPLISGAVFDSCSFYCATGVLGFTTVGCAPTDYGWEDLSITNCSFISEDPCPPGDFDNKPLRIHYGHNLTFNHNVVITRNAGDGVGGGADDTEPVGFYDLQGDCEIGWNYFYTDNNRVSGATGRSGFISVRGWSTGVYIHDNYIRSGYKTLNVGGGGRHRVIRNVIFGGMDVPQDGGTEASGIQISGTDPSQCNSESELPPDGNLPGRNRFESNLIVSYGSPFFMSSTRGADSLVCNTVLNLTGGTDDPSAIEFGSFCDPQFGTEYLRNNIFVSTLASDPVLDVNTGCQDLTIDADHNLYWNRGGGPVARWTNGTTYATLAAFQSGASQEANGLSGNPGLVAPVATWGDTLASYRLSALSLAIDQGDSTWLAFATDLDVLDRVVGAAVDLGPYEFGNVAPTLQGACCQIDGTCTVSTESDCLGLLGGIYQGDNTECVPDPCDPPIGACCFITGNCQVLLEGICEQFFGTFQGDDTDCDPDPCPDPTGSCCYEDETCDVLTPDACEAAGGTFLGIDVACVEPCLATRWDQPAVGPKRALLYVRPRNLISQNTTVSDAEAEIAAEYGLIASALRPDEIQPVRALRPDLIALWPQTFFGVPDVRATGSDYQLGGGGFEMNGIQLADTTWSAARKIQYAYIENLRAGGEWAYQTVARDRIYIYGQVALNWTDSCPEARGGPAIGKTYREYATEVYEAILRDPDFTVAFDGIWFDTMPPACCFSTSYDGVDYDLDGDNDFCSGSCITAKLPGPTGNEWVRQETSNTEAFMAAILTSRDPGQIIIPGQDWVSTASRPDFNGWKSEGWLRQNGTDYPYDWFAWWNGVEDSSPHGMVEAESTLVGLPETWQGWDLSVIDATVNPESSEPYRRRYVRQALGSAMLGDGWLSTGFYDGITRYIAPEETTWVVQTPAVADFEHPSASIWTRKYLRINNDSCMVVVDSTRSGVYPFGDAWLYGHGACCIAESCALRFENECIDAGGIYYGDDVTCSPNPCPDPDPTGACCVDEVCSIETQADCAGTYQGNDTTCSPDPCDIPEGACCFASGACVVTEETACNGTYRGDGTICDPNPCAQPEGACCEITGVCSVGTLEECDVLQGVYRGDDTDCDPNPCPQLSQACCFPDATCQDLIPVDCVAVGGLPRGQGTRCTTTPCASNGACCVASGACFVMPSSICLSVFLGQFQGPGTDCDPNPCAQPIGACCRDDGGCSEITAAACTAISGQYRGNGTICEPDPCPPLIGACCFAFSFCQVILEADCTAQGGSFEGVGTSCDPNPCPETLGACCASDGSCTLDDVTDCTDAGGAWYGAGSVCADTDCPQPTGACCLGELVGGSCVVATETACLDANGEWHQGEHCDDVDCSRMVTGGSRVIYGEATYISSNGSTVNHCNGTTLRLGGTPTPLSDGNLVIRFTTPALPAGARVIAAEIVGTVVTTTAGAEPGDIEVYQLARDPVICEATWEIYATGSDWGEDGGLAIPSDRILPALTDQLGDGSTLTAGTELDLVTGPAALRFADSLLRTGTASILVTCEVDHVWLSGDLGAAPVRMTLTYAVGSSRRRAVKTQ